MDFNDVLNLTQGVCERWSVRVIEDGATVTAQSSPATR